MIKSVLGFLLLLLLLGTYIVFSDGFRTLFSEDRYYITTLDRKRLIVCKTIEVLPCGAKLTDCNNQIEYICAGRVGHYKTTDLFNEAERDLNEKK